VGALAGGTMCANEPGSRCTVTIHPSNARCISHTTQGTDLDHNSIGCLCDALPHSNMLTAFVPCFWSKRCRKRCSLEFRGNTSSHFLQASKVQLHLLDPVSAPFVLHAVDRSCRQGTIVSHFSIRASVSYCKDE
jgi:hypothetical protein